MQIIPKISGKNVFFISHKLNIDTKTSPTPIEKTIKGSKITANITPKITHSTAKRTTDTFPRSGSIKNIKIKRSTTAKIIFLVLNLYLPIFKFSKKIKIFFLLSDKFSSFILF